MDIITDRVGNRWNHLGVKHQCRGRVLQLKKGLLDIDRGDGWKFFNLSKFSGSHVRFVRRAHIHHCHTGNP